MNEIEIFRAADQKDDPWQFQQPVHLRRLSTAFGQASVGSGTEAKWMRPRASALVGKEAVVHFSQTEEHVMIQASTCGIREMFLSYPKFKLILRMQGYQSVSK